MAKEKKVVAVNRKARHDYSILETFEAGIVLTGTEVKSLRRGKVSLQDSYADVKNGEVWIYNLHISPYEHGNIYNHDPKRPRKLLLNKDEIAYLVGKVRERGLTLIPLSIYFNERGWAKVELGLAKGKKLYDKRRDIAERDERRELERLYKLKY
ncbi:MULTISPECIES: SsrA-binding protein SmpB [Dictyoglomus]|jgi:SsrA-binding protein|uniref:SsrA-binding protein n=1 Tax=Dictyoglomus turgidum (strain DSM 6724 / Z-1310) TaxID=515635 RepID=B8E0I0_DICTD|nr:MULTISPECIES: SsrA-binding protein SmpB [Dictyoglomus]ACK42625.1 SsrA-binding protein [Dictyoglomus turgidum DSM 6724]PNV80507.1 MAG: SsrA-binding protein SmpB [Dictyoglomus turgidum]HBU31148.1 SsrA-binding protein SmpB [Dictyoglomus sp.]